LLKKKERKEERKKERKKERKPHVLFSPHQLQYFFSFVHNIVGGNVNYYNHFREQYGGYFKKLKIDLLYDPGSLPLVMLSKEDDVSISKKYLHVHVYCGN
jgi:hypothetical protein